MPSAWAPNVSAPSAPASPSPARSRKPALTLGSVAPLGPVKVNVSEKVPLGTSTAPSCTMIRVDVVAAGCA